MRLYKFLLWKAYFDKGFSLTNYLKYFLVLFGWATEDIKTTIIISAVWCLCCLIIGRLWFKFKLIETENEIANIFNPFCRDVRKHLKKKN
jgi:hypothetical protein